MIGHIPSHFIVLQDTTHVRILYSLDRVCAVFSVMCIEIYGFIPHLAVWGMTRVSTSFVLGALPKMLKCRGGGMTTRPYIYIYILTHTLDV